MSELPSTIARYQIRRRLGRGSRGLVYQGFDPVLNRDVALKLPAPDAIDDLGWSARFLAEARLTGRLFHEHIVEIYDVGRHEGSPFVCMEYLSGESLAQLIRARRAGSLDARLEMIDALCAGLAYAHQCEVLHRDIRPTNIMLDDRSVVKIVDFRIDKFELPGTFDDEPSAPLSRPGWEQRFVGTVDYMAPEQLSGRPVDHRSDIFSAGVTFYELLAYRRPFADRDVASMARKIMHDRPAPLDAIVPDIGPAIAAVVERMLAKQPVDRYQDFAAIREELGAARQQARARGHSAARPPADPGRADPVPLTRTLDDAREAFMRGDLDETNRLCEIALKYSLDDAAAQALRGRARRQLAERQVVWCLAEALQHLERGELTVAEGLIARAEAIDSDAPDVRRARQSLETGRPRARLADAPVGRKPLSPTAEDRVPPAEDQPWQEQEERRARQVIAEAQRRFAGGDHLGALADLEAFSPPHPLVKGALKELLQEFMRIGRRAKR